MPSVLIVAFILVLVVLSARHLDPDVRVFEEWQTEHGTPGHRRELGPDGRVYMVRDPGMVPLLASCFDRIRSVIEACARQWGEADFRVHNLRRLMRNPGVSTLAQDAPANDRIAAFTFWTNPGLEPWVCVRVAPGVDANALMNTIVHEMAHVALGFADFATQDEYHSPGWKVTFQELLAFT